VSLISPGDMRELRSFQNSLMESACRFERHPYSGDSDFDETTGIAAESVSEVIYTGPCRYTTARGGGIIVLGDGTVPPQDVHIFTPWDSAPPMFGDIAIITAAPDPRAVGITLQVRDVEFTQYLTARKSSCRTFQPIAQQNVTAGP